MQIQILDYKPSLKKHFYYLVEPWLNDLLKGQLEEEDKFTLQNPDTSYIKNGGFVFFALYNGEVVGCVALKRLDEETFEFAKLFVRRSARNLGIGSALIERCISRCRENEIRQLWLQSTMSAISAHKLYRKLGFVDMIAPKQMEVLDRTEKIMVLNLL